MHEQTLSSRNIDLKFEITDNNYELVKGLKTPYCTLSNNIGTIYLTHEFLSFLWCISFYLFVIYENIQKQIQENEIWDGKIEQNELIEKSTKLLSWGMSLKKNYSNWDKSFMNPSKYDSQEKIWVGSVNKIFLDAISLILFHEYTHIVQDHFSVHDDNDLQKDLEREADNWAKELMVNYNDGDKFKHHTGVGIIIAHLALLFVLKNPRSIKQKKHPDLDVRLFNSLEYFDIKNKKRDFYLKHLASVGLEMFCSIWNININKNNKYQDVEVLLNVYSKKLDEFKNEKCL